MIDERSVRERAAAPRATGRPKMGEKDPRNLVELTLMNRNHAVLDFVYNRRTRETADIVPREGIAWKPLGIGLRELGPNRYDLAAWLAARSIPDLRPRLAPLLRELAARHGSDLMLGSWGLNLSDQYWLKPRGIEVDWYDINYFENGYEEALGESLLDGTAFPAGASADARFARSPDTATPGMLAKAWMRRDGTDCLMKGGTGNENREPYVELLATKLLSRLLDEGEYVSYEIVERGGRAYSSCPTFVTEGTELIPAADVLTAFGVTEERDPHRGYLDAARELGVSEIGRAVSKMIVADHLMANFDRHTYNFGLLRDVESLDGYRVAPLFDHGCGFYSSATTAELEHGRYLRESHPFRPYPSQQLALVDDLSWYDPSRLDGFLDDIADVLGANPHLDGRFIEAV
ncbi:HipA domain-containing protein [Arabiibacter massiliensis]|uniref:DNA-binding protein n=1 Tax=Arabiibacter massiliensis TaxID=1870985 RepID=UPI001E3EA1AA|nr:DNA-binding protein [Arabiibacter massiliensis]